MRVGDGFALILVSVCLGWVVVCLHVCMSGVVLHCVGLRTLAWERAREKGVLKGIKQKTAYEILRCDWSSDVCSSDLIGRAHV